MHTPRGASRHAPSTKCVGKSLCVAFDVRLRVVYRYPVICSIFTTAVLRGMGSDLMAVVG
jgi:hypothetical protein